MNSRKWWPNSPQMPSSKVAGGTFHWRTSGQAGTLPITSAMPVSRKGGTCRSDRPSEARPAHRAMAPSAYRLAGIAAGSGQAGDAGGVGLLVGVVARAHHGAHGSVREAHG